MTYVPHTERETREMPRRDRRRAYGGPVRRRPRRRALSRAQAAAPSSEMEITADMQALAGRNFGFDPSLSFLGAGAYHHFRPATVDYVLRRGEFYTSYTQYQPEASHGHAAGPVRIPEHDLPADRHGGSATPAIMTAPPRSPRRSCSPSMSPRGNAARSSCLRRCIRNIARWSGRICAAPTRTSLPATKTADPILPPRETARWRDGRARRSESQLFGQCEPVDGLADAVHRAGRC